MLRAVLFDLDGTLVDHDAGVSAALEAFRARHLPATPADAFHSAWKAATDLHFPRFVRGEISFREQRRLRMRSALARPDLPDAETDAFYEDYLAAYDAACLPFPDAEPCLSALAAMPLGLISNGDGPQQRGKLRRAGFLDRFATVLISGEAALRKPDPRLFALAARNLGAAPEECAFVGDDPELDYGGAEGAGMRPVLIDRKGKAGHAGRTVIRSLAELPALLGPGRTGRSVGT